MKHVFYYCLVCDSIVKSFTVSVTVAYITALRLPFTVILSLIVQLRQLTLLLIFTNISKHESEPRPPGARVPQTYGRQYHVMLLARGV